MDIIVNTSKIIKLESIPNLNDVVLTIYKSDGNIVTTIAMNENIPNIYEAEFLPPIVGNYTGKIASASLNLVTYFDINVATGVDLSSELTAAKNEIIAEVNANETKIDNLPTLSEIEESTVLAKEDSVQLSIAVSV